MWGLTRDMQVELGGREAEVSSFEGGVEKHMGVGGW